MPRSPLQGEKSKLKAAAASNAARTAFDLPELYNEQNLSVGLKWKQGNARAVIATGCPFGPPASIGKSLSS